MAKYKYSYFTLLDAAAVKKPCNFRGCPRVALFRGLCRVHYNQARSGPLLHPISNRQGRLIRLANPALAPTEHPNARDIAWAAGIYEGEGCADGAYGKRRRIIVTQKDPWLLLRLKSLFGGKIVQAKVRQFNVCRWIVDGPRAAGFALTIFTYLSPRRRGQIKKAFRWNSAKQQVA